MQIEASTRAGAVTIRISDDGRGLDRASLHRKGVAQGLIPANTPLDDPSVTELIFMPGLSTAESVNELSGRGFGCDVLRREVFAIGGMIDVSSTPGGGTEFVLTLPVSIAVTNVLFVAIGGQTVAIPLHHVERAISPDEMDANGLVTIDGTCQKVQSLGTLLELPSNTQHSCYCL